jgi:hypothetical protein
MDYQELLFAAEVRKVAIQIYQERMASKEISKEPLFPTTYKEAVAEAIARITATGRLIREVLEEAKSSDA